MSVTANPSWRVKTKPCEFYKKGRCVFGEDRCNFLHIKSDWSLNEVTLIEAKNVKAPAVKILPDTPPSAVFGSMRSPPRSPRTASLLLALKDVIGSDDEEYEDELSYEAVSDDEDEESSLDAPEKLQNPPAPVQNTDLHIGGDSLSSDFSDDLTSDSHLDDPFAQDSEQPRPSSPHSGLLSPVDFSDLQLKHLSFLQHSRSQSLNKNTDPNSHHRHQDSGFFDTVGTPSSRWVSPSPMALSPPRSPALSSTFELLSFPLGSPSSKLAINAGMGMMSPRLGGSFVPRVPASPSPLLNGSFFPEEDEQKELAEPDLALDSPTEYYQEKQREQREHLLFEQGQEGEQTVRQTQISSFNRENHDVFNDNQQEFDEDFTGPTSRWDSDNRDTAVFLGRPPVTQSQSQSDASEARRLSPPADVVKDQVGSEIEDDVKDALKRSSTTPLNYLITLKKSPLGLEVPEFVDTELQGSSSLIHDQDDTEDVTAQLAYLADSPEVQGDEDEEFEAPGENDTLNSLYNVYSDIESESTDSDGEEELQDAEEAHIAAGNASRTSPSSREGATHVAEIAPQTSAVSAADPELDEESDEEEPLMQDTEEEVFIMRGVPITPSRRTSPSSQKKAAHTPAEMASPPTDTNSPASLSLLRERVFTPPPTNVDSPITTSLRSTPTAPPPLPASPSLQSFTKKSSASGGLPSPSTTSTSASTVQGHGSSIPASQEVVNLNSSPSSPIVNAARSPARKSTGLRPLRLSAVITNFTPTSVVASPTSSTSSSSRDANARSRASVIPPFLPPSSSTLDHSLRIKRNRLSMASVSTSTSSSDFSSSHNALLSSARSSFLIPKHIRHSFINDSSIHGHSYDSAPLPAAEARSSWISGIPPSYTTNAASAPPIPNGKRTSIHRPGSHNENRRSQIYYIRSDSESERGSGSRSAPLVRRPSWDARGSGDSTESRLSGTSSLDSVSRMSRRGSRISYGEGPSTVFEHGNEEELDTTIRGNPVTSLSPSLSSRRGVRDSQQLQIQVHRQSQLYSANALTSSPRLKSPSPVSSTHSVPLPVHSSRSSKRSSRAVLPLTALNSAPLSPPVHVSTLSHPNTPRPTLLFAIASDDPEEVQRVLERNSVVGGKQCEIGSVDVNDSIGPQSQSALAFTLANEGLKNKLGIVKVLLGHGADPSKAGLAKDGQSNPAALADNSEIDPATRYYLSRANAPLTRRIDALMSRSAFRPLARARYKLIGQDHALEQLFRVLSIQSEKISSTPIVVFLCGPSGHGKTLLAHQFGSLLDVPIHTVNMTTLRTADDLWRSYSISSSEDTAPCTLVEFLANNEGKRCVVVLDEIEKTELKALWTLLVPWELGRCTFEANSRNIDVRKVIWVGTSNIGNDLILEHHASRQRPKEMISREEYVELMGILRPRVSDQLGASVLSRVSAILPFVPFTMEEQTAIASEFLQESAAEHLVQELSREQKEMIVNGALKDFVPAEGARSLYRAVSNLLVDSLDV